MRSKGRKINNYTKHDYKIIGTRRPTETFSNFTISGNY